MDNQDVAILNKINTLAEKHGFAVHEFACEVIQNAEHEHKKSIAFSYYPGSNHLNDPSCGDPIHESFRTMCNETELAFTSRKYRLTSQSFSAEEILDRLDRAINAPALTHAERARPTTDRGATR